MSGWNVSPVDEVVQSTLELSDGLEVVANVLKCDGTDGGFIDNFDGAVVDSANWTEIHQAIIDNGRLTFTTGGGNGYTIRYVGSNSFFGGKYNLKNASVIVTIPIIDTNERYILFGCSDTLNNAVNGVHTRITVRIFPSSANKADMSFYGSANNNYPSISNLSVGDVLKFMFKTTGEKDIAHRTTYKLYYKKNNEDWVDSGASGPAYDRLWISSYYDSETQKAYVESVEIYGYKQSAIATLPESESYTALSPAKLASVDTITPHISTAGAGGTINLHVQHKSDEDADYVDLSGNLNSWTDLGVIDGSAITVPAYLSRTNDKFRYKLTYSGDGLHSYPEIDKLTFAWSSDVVAPAQPVVSEAISASQNIAVVQFDTLPADGYAYTLDVNINGAGSLPLSERNKIESGHGHLRLVGNQTNVERTGERNSRLVGIDGLMEGDALNITSYTRDNVGNISAGTTTALVMSGAQYVPNFVTKKKGVLKAGKMKGRIK